MPMERYLAGWSIRSIPSTTYSRDFNAISDMAFTNAPNVFTDVQTETTYGSGIFSTISQVRVASVFDISTGQNLGDDFKRFIFESTFTPTIGQMFYWKSSYWIAINSDNYQSLAKALIVRRCNNMLRWYDSYKNLIEEPCILSYVLKESGDYTTSQMIISSGFITLSCQRNARTITLKENDRFLFGVPTNRKSYKIYGNGIKLYLNSVTEDETSPSVAEFYMGASFINPYTDDITNGIANAYNNDYTLAILDGDIIQTSGFSKTLTAEVKYEGVIVTQSVVWTSSNETVATITSGGVVSCLTTGNTTIRCAMVNNLDVYDEITVYVQDVISDNYNVEISPEATIIYEGETQTYSCYLTNNGIPTADTFGFTASGVPADNYRLYVVDGNTFRVENIEKYLTSTLDVLCTSGIHTKTLSINLRGGF